MPRRAVLLLLLVGGILSSDAVLHEPASAARPAPSAAPLVIPRARQLVVPPALVPLVNQLFAPYHGRPMRTLGPSRAIPVPPMPPGIQGYSCPAVSRAGSASACATKPCVVFTRPTPIRRCPQPLTRTQTITLRH